MQVLPLLIPNHGKTFPVGVSPCCRPSLPPPRSQLHTLCCQEERARLSLDEDAFPQLRNGGRASEAVLSRSPGRAAVSAQTAHPHRTGPTYALFHAPGLGAVGRTKHSPIPASQNQDSDSEKKNLFARLLLGILRQGET